MAEFSPSRLFSAKRRALVIGAIVLVGGAVGGGVALASSSRSIVPASSPGGPAATATVVRTTLINTVQVGGSVGYNGSYTVAAPSGASASTIAQDQQAVAADDQALSADEQAESDASASGDQAVAAAQASVGADQAALAADQAAEAKACAGSGASSSACTGDEQKVSTDQAALTQARQQLAAAQAAAKADDDQAQAKVGADQVKLRGDQATLTSDQATAMNPGTTYTWLPQVGQVIRQDQRAYAVSGEPVPLLYGSVPAYRAFYVGMPDGRDVGELTRDLIALGYGDGLAHSDHYSPATAAAVERWQKARGLPVTGEILLGEVVFEPGPIRVTSVTPSVGASIAGGGGGGGGSGSSGGGGTVLTATGTTPVVTVDLGVSQEYLVKPGDAVSVVMPDGTTTVGGHVETVGTVATCPGGSGTGTGGGSSGSGSAGQSPCSSAGSNGSAGSNSSPTVTVTITLDATPPGASLDQAPVNVNITTQTVSNVLAVPVNALLALQGGGFGVDVVTGSGAVRLVGVTTGLYSNTMVQVSGPGISAGTRVEVSSS
jgi:multidrug efflux pump subunit AcrA (membrane-fusion protein)